MSMLVARGNSAKRTVGLVNFADFFVTFAQSVTLVITFGLANWWMTVRLLIGGVVAAPLAAYWATEFPLAA